MYFLFLSMFLLFAKVASQEPTIISTQCDEAQIESCLKPIYMDTEGILGQTFTDDKLASICGNLASAKSCFYLKAKSCLKKQVITELNLIDVVTYICTDEGKKGLKAIPNCIATTNFLAAYDDCFKKTATIVDYNNVGSICRQVNGNYSCYVSSAKICNLEAFATNFYLKLRESMANVLYGCNPDFRNWDTKVYSQCDVKQYLNCFSTTTPDIIQILDNPLNLKLLSATNDQVNKACSAVDTIYNCVTKTAKCEETGPLAQSYIGIYWAYQYICKTDRPGFDKIAACFSRNPTMFSQCTITPSDCSSFMTLQKCVTDSTMKTCGTSAAVDNFFYKNFGPILNQTVGGCNLVAPSKTSNTKNADERIQSIFLIVFFSILIYYA